MFQIMRQTAHEFGYEPYNGPLLEEVELYKAKSGEELINEQIYSFYDRGERFVAIRPEMTPTAARMVAQIHREEVKPIRWFSIPNLMRYERPQKGRLREHWQFNVDIFGAPTNMGEIEILQLAVKLLTNFGANHNQFEILINDRNLVDFIFQNIFKITSEEEAYNLYKIIDRSKKVDKQALEKLIAEKLQFSQDQSEKFFSYLDIKTTEELFKFVETNNEHQTICNFKAFIGQLDELGLTEFIKYDPSIVRGLDYYTGIVFEIFDKNPENRRAICGGGSFANLLKIFNETPLPGVGFGLGDVTLKDFLVTHKLLPDLSKPENDILITFQEPKACNMALILAKALREKGLRVLTSLGPLKFKKAFSFAEKKGAQYIALIGENEFEDNSVQIKNRSTQEQKTIEINNIDEIIKLISGELND